MRVAQRVVAEQQQVGAIERDPIHAQEEREEQPRDRHARQVGGAQPERRATCRAAAGSARTRRPGEARPPASGRTAASRCPSQRRTSRTATTCGSRAESPRGSRRPAHSPSRRCGTRPGSRAPGDRTRPRPPPATPSGSPAPRRCQPSATRPPRKARLPTMLKSRRARSAVAGIGPGPEDRGQQDEVGRVDLEELAVGAEPLRRKPDRMGPLELVVIVAPRDDPVAPGGQSGRDRERAAAATRPGRHGTSRRTRRGWPVSASGVREGGCVVMADRASETKNSSAGWSENPQGSSP